MPEPSEAPTYDHVVEHVVRFGDLDPQGHVNNVALVRIVETGRVEFHNDLGLRGSDPSGFVLAALHVSFRAQAFYRDVLAVGTRVTRIGRTSFTLDHRIWRMPDDVTIAEAESVLVVTGEDGASSSPIPDTWRERLAEGAVRHG